MRKGGTKQKWKNENVKHRRESMSKGKKLENSYKKTKKIKSNKAEKDLKPIFIL